MDEEDAEKAEGNAHGDAIAEGLPAPFRKAGAQVLGGGGGHGGHHGRGDQEEEADDFFHNPHGRRRFHAAVAGNGGDDQEGYLDETVLAGNGNAYGKDASHPGAAGVKSFLERARGDSFRWR